MADEPEVWKPIGSATVTSTLARMAGLSVPIRENGAVVFCNEVSDFYRFSTSGTASGNEVIASTTASGCFWIRMHLTSIGTTSVVWQPGGTASNGVYTDFNALYAAVSSSPFTEIVIDTSHSGGVATLPAATTYDFQNAYIRGLLTPLSALYAPELRFPTNTIFHGVQGLDNIQAISTGTTPGIQYPTGSGAVILPLYGLASISSTSTSPTVRYATGGGDSLLIDLFDNTSLRAPAGAATSVVQITGPGNLIIAAFSGLNLIFNDVLGAPTQAQVFLQFGANAQLISTTQTGILDTGLAPTQGAFGVADNVLYAAGGVTVERALSAFKRGTSTLANGVSPAIATTITATSRIVATRKALNASTAIADLSALTADRVIGAPGSFKVTSVRLTTLATETNDQSSFDWEVID